MPTWGSLLIELNNLAAEGQRDGPLQPGQPAPTDILRRKYLAQLAEATRRGVILYESAWLETRPMDQDAISVHLGDVQGFMEAVSNVNEREVDLFLHSPGGSAEAAESIIRYLRTRFDHIRAIVPVAAMSAATMMALGADEIVMGAHSQLGPIDPQFWLATPEGPRSAPGQAILDQFDQAKKEIAADPPSVLAWTPILRSYGPGLLAQVDHQRQLAKKLVANWLEQYMLKEDAGNHDKAEQIASWFSDFRHFQSHGRGVGRDEARARGLSVTDLENDHEIQDAILSVHHACQLTFSPPGALPIVLKIIENHHGRAWMKTQVAIQMAPNLQPQPGTRPAPIPRPPSGPNRGGQRRRRR